ncbi:MAG: hypothetical protein HY914_22390 [Desulfomonile tiedjei]|nr:hypothetical protein [Desulfomonile tiedjei]
MPRFLFLVSFLAVCLLALPGVNLFAAQSEGKDPVSSFKNSELKSSTSLARILKNSQPLTSSTSKMSSKKSKTDLKSATGKSKKLTKATHATSKKLAHKKSKSSKRGLHRKSAPHKKAHNGKVRASKRSPHRS